MTLASQQRPLIPTWSASELPALLEQACVSIARIRFYPDGAWIQDYQSPGCQAILGYSAAEILADQGLWQSRIDPDDRVNIVKPLFLTLAQGQSAQLEYRFQHRSGAWRWLSQTLTSQWDEIEQCWQITAVTHDISDRKRAEQALLTQETMLRRLGDNIPQGYIYQIQTQDQRVLGCSYASRGIETVLGLRAEQLRDGIDPFIAMVHEADRPRILQAIQAAIATRSMFEEQFRIWRPDTGELRWMNSLAAPRDIGEGRVVWDGLQTDITPLKQAELDLREARDRAEAANLAKSEFLATMSHEIRTPLNAVIGMTDLLLNTPLSPDQQESVTTIRDGGSLLMTIINDVLDFSRIEAGQLDLEDHVFPLRRSLESVLQLLNTSAIAKGLNLQFTCETTLPRYLRGDSTRLQQILANLVGNAIKFTSQGHVSVRVAPWPPIVAGEAEAAGPDRSSLSQFCIQVEDSGVGIAPEFLASLFEPFCQGDRAITRCYGGTGLGLAICKRLVERMGGQIWVDSQLGQGSRFTFTLPLQAAAAPTGPNPAPSRVALSAAQSLPTAIALAVPAHPPASPSAHPPASPSANPSAHPSAHPSARPLNILLVEDNPTNQKLAQMMLTRLGHQANVVNNGQEALDLLLGQASPASLASPASDYDVILMDVQMPVLDGLAATRMLRQHKATRSLWIIGLSASAFDESRTTAEVAGMNDYLTKPLRLETLKAALDRAPGTRLTTSCDV